MNCDAVVIGEAIVEGFDLVLGSLRRLPKIVTVGLATKG